MKMPFSSTVQLLTFWQLGYAYPLSVIEFAAYGACDAWSIMTPLCAPSCSVTKELESTTIVQNGLSLRGIILLYAVAGILLMMPELVSDKWGFSMRT